MSVPIARVLAAGDFKKKYSRPARIRVDDVYGPATNAHLEFEYRSLRPNGVYHYQMFTKMSASQAIQQGRVVRRHGPCRGPFGASQSAFVDAPSLVRAPFPREAHG